jgi:predicted Zn-dependent peptidase
MSFTKKVFPNKLTLFTIPKKDAFTATVLVLVEAGSKYETKDINGISHFLEHMCFKGTKKRPHAIDISGELDSVGAAYNAFTGHEYTGYYAKVDKAHIEKALDVVSDIYLNQIFRPNEIKRESGVIVEEINMYKDDPKRKVYDNFTELLYGDTPAGWNIAGTCETVRAVNEKKLSMYREKHYVAEATTVVIAGAIDEKKIINFVEKKFSGIRQTEKYPKEKVLEQQSKPNISLEYKKSDQSHIILGVRTFSVKDKRSLPLKVLSTVLGGGMSSRLFQTIREKLGAAYYVRSFVDEYTDHGYLGVSVGADTKRTKEVVKAVISEFKKLAKTPVSQKELKRMKDNIIGTTALSLETTDEIAFYYGMQHVLKKEIKTPEEFMKAVSKITAKDVQTLARQIFKDENLNLAIIGPMENENEIVPLLSL